MRSLVIGPKYAYSTRFVWICFKMAMESSVFDRLYLDYQSQPMSPEARLYLPYQLQPKSPETGINWGGERRYDIDARCSGMRGILSTTCTGAMRPGHPISFASLRDKITQFVAGTEIGEEIRRRMAKKLRIQNDSICLSLPPEVVRNIIRWYWTDVYFGWRTRWGYGAHNHTD
jgi:hypothetical protein